jgi:hypothetical protein
MRDMTQVLTYTQFVIELQCAHVKHNKIIKNKLNLSAQTMNFIIISLLKVLILPEAVSYFMNLDGMIWWLSLGKFHHVLCEQTAKQTLNKTTHDHL